MQGAITWESSLFFPAVVFLAGVAASLPPAIRASRLSPVDAMRRGA